MHRNLILIMTCSALLAGLAACGTFPDRSAPIVSHPVNGGEGSTPMTLSSAIPFPTSTAVQPTLIAAQEKANLRRVPGEYIFAEGPAVDVQGSVYFSDISAGKIYKWMSDGSVNVFVSGLQRPNGLAIDATGQLIVCEGGNGRLLSITPQGQISVLVDQYQEKRFNEPNDLWIDPQGGIYFSDPAYQSALSQDSEQVYYIFPDHSSVVRVTHDLQRPNGLVGSLDGKYLFIADAGAGKIYRYPVNTLGSLGDRQLFIAQAADGMKLDAQGNLYLAALNQVEIYDATGSHVRDIPLPESPTNLAFVGADHGTLFITARSQVYTFLLASALTSGFTLTSPEVNEGGPLPVDYTCDGVSATLPLAWNGAPAGTIGYAVIMHHEASPSDVHWYWLIYDLPATVTNLPRDSQGVGTLGTNSVNKKNAYTPPCSKGPGPKVYTYTVYALSAQPILSVPASQVNRAVLLDAIRDITLASAELHVTYTRK